MLSQAFSSHSQVKQNPEVLPNLSHVVLYTNLVWSVMISQKSLRKSLCCCVFFCLSKGSQNVDFSCIPTLDWNLPVSWPEGCQEPRKKELLRKPPPELLSVIFRDTSAPIAKNSTAEDPCNSSLLPNSTKLKQHHYLPQVCCIKNILPSPSDTAL